MILIFYLQLKNLQWLQDSEEEKEEEEEEEEVGRRGGRGLSYQPPRKKHRRLRAPSVHTPKLCDYVTTPDTRNGLARCVCACVWCECLAGVGTLCYYYFCCFSFLLRL